MTILNISGTAQASPQQWSSISGTAPASLQQWSSINRAASVPNCPLLHAATAHLVHQSVYVLPWGRNLTPCKLMMRKVLLLTESLLRAVLQIRLTCSQVTCSRPTRSRPTRSRPTCSQPTSDMLSRRQYHRRHYTTTSRTITTTSRTTTTTRTAARAATSREQVSALARRRGRLRE